MQCPEDLKDWHIEEVLEFLPLEKHGVEIDNEFARLMPEAHDDVDDGYVPLTSARCTIGRIWNKLTPKYQRIIVNAYNKDR